GVRRHLDRHVLDADLRYATDDAAGGDHLVAFLEGLDHRLLLLGPLNLRPDHEEIEQHEHQDDGQEAHQAGVAAGGRALCKGGGDDHYVSSWESGELYLLRSASSRWAAESRRPDSIAARSSRIRC